MSRTATFLCTAAFASVGAWLGLTIHGAGPTALLTTAAGALGGFGIAAAIGQVRAFRSAGRGQGEAAGSVPPA